MNRHLIILSAALWTAAPTFAQSPAAPPAVPVGTAQAYQIAPDDLLSVTVVNAANLSAPQVTVLQDGTISLPFLKTPVSVVGKTPSEVSQDLTRRLDHWLVNPSVTVALVGRHRTFAYVSGFVAHPQSVELTPMLHVMDAVAEAGDVLPNGDLSLTTVTHADGTRQMLDLSPAASRAGTLVNPLLLSGDAISVPEQRAEISVIGQVGRPGSYNYKSDMTVLDALTAAGNVNMDDADLPDATLTHGGRVTPLDLEAMLHGANLSQNVKLSAGDQISVPKAPRTYVYGAVGKAGFYSFKPGDKVLDALNASSVSPYANYTKVHVVHVDKTKTVAVVQQINMEDYFKKGNLSANPTLQPGDAVYIETKGEPKQPWYSVLAPIGIVAQAAHFLF